MSSSPNNPQDQPWPNPYERPNQKWSCGRTDQVFPCPLGPDARGRCRTTAECAPALEKKSGEEKGRYLCTRRAEYGGPCSEGPLPTGACSHSRPPCAPIRTWRSRRALFTYWILGLTLASLLLLLHGPFRFQFTNPGPLSSVHAQPRSGLNHAQQNRVGTENCGACHRASDSGFQKWVEAAAGANPHPFEFAGFTRPGAPTPTHMDAACADCHKGHQFHHVNLSQEQSCIRCHQEHKGDEGLHVKTDQHCVDCHGNSARMAEATGATVHTNQDSRPPAIITRFSKGHPEFGPVASKMKDPNTLRFNHQKHFSAEVVGPNGKALQCTACHLQDAAGEYYEPIRFEKHCQACHSLQFDPANPELQLPHGDVEFVKAFLGSLPQQYEQLGERVRGITEKRALRAFVDAQMKRLQEQQLTGTSLEDEIFLNRNRRVGGNNRTAPFYGCAYCHEVTRQGNAVTVVKAEVPLRWLSKADFHHRSHQNVDCTICHGAIQSSQTADILLPSVKTCASCHNSKAAPGESCMLCHDFHHWTGKSR